MLDGSVAPNLVIVSFLCRSKAARFFSDRIFKINGEQKEYLSTIVKEAGKAFDSPLADPNLKLLSRRTDAVFGAEQMIRLSLEALFDFPFTAVILYGPRHSVRCLC